MDEEQDLSYKQWDMNPRYDAHALAKHKALLYHCQLTFGSSAPSVDAYSRIKNKKYKLIALNKTKTCAAMTIIDMRRELHKKNYSIFSDALLDNLKECLQEKKQAIIFVNRRGLATFVMCRDCGHIERCPNCNIALVEQSGSKLNCNHCSFKSQIPLICPKCRSHRIKGFGTGAERVQQELTKIFPQAKISRADLTNTSNLPLTAEKYHDLLSGNVDVLVGTGIAIRLTSPRLRFLAAVNIDSIMNFPDWRADEKSWQIIKQMSVREDVKHCLIQTYNPDHKLFNAKNFYEQELNNRSTLSYPPFYQMIKLICKSDDFTFLLTESSRVANELRAKIPDIEIIGPIDPINAKIRNFWLKNIMIKFPLNIDFSQKKVIIENIIKNLSNNWSVDVDPLT
ncbi:primosomal protein N' [Candidatus Falkowbacteria bacterium CG10_big_fil_rev_8_21_14_0_10_37_6]|uniref:Primosomal protein N n=1 Tax=Candidatus Falkowbacteria bacterium CG10_big_fil_rev_8_21_14_0_10_37_6 TaxID=1974563 RepID=A0A2H0V909_9BACT|nr:MAG: primosomal protein N' [Candidatus Falkowbacteria bacterium CG10_big_fil_rev_8_21_14_0_10_37_6]